MYPKHWKQFSAAAGSGQVTNSTAANRFAARYRLAACFEAVVFRGISKSTTDGFGVLLRVTLAANSLESALRLNGKPTHAIDILDPMLAVRLRSLGDKLIDTLTQPATGERLSSEMSKRLSATRSRRLQKALDDLGNSVLEVADDEFERYLRSELGPGIASP